MTVKQLWSKARKCFSPKSSYGSIEQLYEEIPAKYQSDSAVDLLEPDNVKPENITPDTFEQIVFQKESVPEKKDKTEVLVEAFEKLVDKLDNINSTFNRQIDRDEKIAEILSELPSYAAGQSESLREITEMMKDSSQNNSELSRNFCEFNGTLDKLNSSTIQQSNMLAHMNNTFASSDRYLKHIVEKQNRRFMWMFYSAIGICTFALVSTVAAVVLLLNG